MILAVDVDYHSDHAIAAGVLFEDWADSVAAKEIVIRVDDIEPYVPGQFFRRELPCIQIVIKALGEIDLDLDFVVVDGYAWLTPTKPGLGAHLYQSSPDLPVLGVAKSYFSETQAVEVKRGGSTRPLHVTGAGLPDHVAASYVTSMHGPYRIPTLLKRVDALCRGNVS